MIEFLLRMFEAWRSKIQFTPAFSLAVLQCSLCWSTCTCSWCVAAVKGAGEVHSHSSAAMAMGFARVEEGSSSVGISMRCGRVTRRYASAGVVCRQGRYRRSETTMRKKKNYLTWEVRTEKIRSKPPAILSNTT